MEIDQPYTSSIVSDIAKITKLDEDDVMWMTSKELTDLCNKHP
jgi:hypothetical protein